MRRFLLWLINRFPREEIGTADAGVYLERWHLASWGGRNLYLHRFAQADPQGDPHDHPRSFWTLPLRGHYFEQAWSPHPEWPWMLSLKMRHVRWPVPRFRRAEHMHRIAGTGGRSCWTLVLMLKARREWGFLAVTRSASGRLWDLVQRGGSHWIPHREYTANSGGFRRWANRPWVG